MSQKLIEKVENYVVALFEQCRHNLVYHDINHTKRVVLEVKKACDNLEFNDSERLVLTIAAWFHDLGYLNNYESHEAESITEFQRFSEDVIDLTPEMSQAIIGCIRATEMGVFPKNELEAVINDIDIAYALYTNFKIEGDKLREEKEAIQDVIYTDKQWKESQEHFLKAIQLKSTYGLRNFQSLLTRELEKINVDNLGNNDT